MQVVGIDGCKFGWVAVSLEFNGNWSISKHQKIGEVFDQYPHANRYLIDMVIGLADKDHQRPIETLARERLKPNRTSSVFTPPCRAAVYASDYNTAKLINIEVVGKSISIQAWNICKKIKELDLFLRKNISLKSKVWEAHPEICFAALNKRQAMEFKKSSLEGELERAKILQHHFLLSKNIISEGKVRFLKKEVKPDDVLDALCLAVNALLGEQGAYDFIFSEKNRKDEFGLEMKMCCWKGEEL